MLKVYRYFLLVFFLSIPNVYSLDEYTRSTEIHPCKLNRDDLLELEHVIKQRFYGLEETYFSISTNIKHHKIETTSITTLLENKNLPDTLTNLEFSAGQHGDFWGIKILHLSFEKTRILLSVSGLDEAWVNGTYYTVKGFLSEKRPWFNFLGDFWWFVITYFILDQLIYFIVWIFRRPSKSTRNKLIVLSSVLYFSLMSLKFGEVIFPHTQIIIKENPTFNSQNIYSVISILVTILIPIIIELVRYLRGKKSKA